MELFFRILLSSMIGVIMSRAIMTKRYDVAVFDAILFIAWVGYTLVTVG